MTKAKEEWKLENIIFELAEIFYRSSDYFNKKKVMTIIIEEWEDITEERAEYLARSIIRTINAVHFLKKRFPNGRISTEKIQEISNIAPFDEITLEFASKIINLRKDRKKQKNVFAFPRLAKMII